MDLYQIGKLQTQLQFGKPDGNLVRAELSLCQLNVQQPVIRIRGLWPFAW